MSMEEKNQVSEALQEKSNQQNRHLSNVANSKTTDQKQIIRITNETANQEPKTEGQKKIMSNENQFYKRPGTTDKGKHYEDYMVAKLILDCVKNDNVDNFKISSNDDNFGAFDDLILEIKWQNQTDEKWAVQLKHNNAGKVLPFNNLTATSGNFSIKKYFNSFKKSKGSNTDFNFILMTNLKFDARDGTQIQISDDENFQISIHRTESKELLNTSKEIKHCYKFEIVKSGTICPFSKKLNDYEEFFNKFYLYTNQTNVDNIEKCVAQKFKTLFGGDKALSDKYIKFIEKWSEREGTKEKLDKTTMKKVISMYLLDRFIHPFSFGPVHENAKILQSAVNKFTITLVDKRSLDECRRLWGDTKHILKNIDIKEINRIIRMYEPTFGFIDNLDKLSSKDCTQLLWFMDTTIPMIVSEDPLIFEAINLCEDRAYMLIRDNESHKLPKDYTVFEKLSDLTNHFDILNDLTKSFKCKLLGSEISLDQLVMKNELFREIITTNEIIEMVEKPYGVTEERQEVLPPSYISRNLSITIIDFQYLETVGENTFVVFSNVKRMEPSLKNYSHRKNFLIKTDELSKEEFKVIRRGNANMKKIRHFEISYGKLQLIRNIGDISDLEKYRIEGYSLKDVSFNDPDKYNNINMIVAEPGMGKSVFLNSLKNNLSSHIWTILFAPNDIYEICRFARHEKDQNKIDNFMIELKYTQHKKIDKVILKVLIKEGDICYLWDALDEISSEDLRTIIGLIQSLSQRDSIQWITSRPHLKEYLENKFNVFSFKIKPFDDEHQTCYIYDRLKTIISEEKIEDITQSIKNNVAFAADINILGIPLQLYMLTELFLRNEEMYENLSQNKLLSLADLYTYFVEEIFDFHYKIKNSIVLLSHQQEEILKELKKNRIENYKRAALKLLIDKNVLSALNIQCDDFLQEIQTNGDHVGFVTQITADGENVKFLHNSYAEYFVALYFAENYKKIPNFENVIFHKRHTNIRFFFDCLLAKGFLPHIAVLNRNFETLKKYEDVLKDCKDRGGRNVLHLVASWGETYLLNAVYKTNTQPYKINEVLKLQSPKYDLEMLKYLLEKCDVQELDYLFKLSSLSYAEKSGCFLNLIVIENCKRTGYLNWKSDKLTCNILFYSSFYGYEGIFESHNNKKHYNMVTRCDDTLLHVACKEGHFKIVNFLIKSGIEINSTNYYKCTPLHYAARHGHYDIVQELIKSGAIIHIISDNGSTPLNLAMEYGHYAIAEMLDKDQNKENNLVGTNQQPLDITKTAVVERFGRTPLHIAAEKGNYQKSVSEINLRTNLDVVDRLNVTPLFLASYNGHRNIAELLINSGATVDLADKDGDTPLHAACYNGQQEIVTLLINSGATVNLVDNFGDTALHLASLNVYQDVVQLLVNSGATVNAANKVGHTPLRLACFNGPQEIVQLLINSGATVNCVDNVGDTPLHLASLNGNQDVVLLLINAGATVNATNKAGYTPLRLACFSGHQEIVLLLINSGATVNLVDNVGDTALHLASLNGNQDVVQLLVNSGATVNAANKKGNTPLRLACYSGHQYVVQLLINSGATVNLVDNVGDTALHLASLNGNQDVVQLLVNSGATVNAANKKGHTPLRSACYSGHQYVVQLLINSGATVNLADNLGDTPLYVSCYNGHRDIVQLLINSGATVNAANKDGYTPLRLASFHGHQDVVQLLINSGATVNAANKDGYTPICAACFNGHQDVVQLLINYGATVNLVNVGYTPLHFACLNGQQDTVQLLINSGASVNLVDTAGDTPLYVSCSNGHHDVVQLLINSGATVNAVNKKGHTPLHVAGFNGHQEVVQLLIDSGATLNAANKGRLHTTNCSLL